MKSRRDDRRAEAHNLEHAEAEALGAVQRGVDIRGGVEREHLAVGQHGVEDADTTPRLSESSPICRGAAAAP